MTYNLNIASAHCFIFDLIETNNYDCRTNVQAFWKGSVSMKKKFFSFILCAVMFCVLAMNLPGKLETQAAVYPPRVFEQTLTPGEVSIPYFPAMRDTFHSYSNTNSSVADIEYTDPSIIYIVGKEPGSTVITLYGEFYDTIINVTVTEANQKE